MGLLSFLTRFFLIEFIIALLVLLAFLGVNAIITIFVEYLERVINGASEEEKERLVFTVIIFIF